MTGLLSQYLGYGADADKPTPPDVVEGVLALYWAEDITTLYRWNWNGDPDPLWEAVAQPGVTEAPTDGGSYVRQSAGWVAETTGLADAPSDGSQYVRKDGAWAELVVPEGYTDADADARVAAGIAAATRADLSDVDATAPTDGQVLKWDEADSTYKPGDSAAGPITPSIVQYATGISNSGAVTLPAAPTPGNLLLAIGTHWSNNSVNLPWIATRQQNGSSHEGVFIATHVVTPADTVGPYTAYSTSGGGNTVIFEIADWDGQIFMNGNTFQEQTATTHKLQNGVPKDGSLVVGFFCSYSSNVAPTSLTGATALDQGVGTASNISPREISPFWIESDQGGIEVDATYADSRERAGIIITLLPR